MAVLNSVEESTLYIQAILQGSTLHIESFRARRDSPLVTGTGAVGSDLPINLQYFPGEEEFALRFKT